jgi:Protein of unknown function, DUF547
MLALVLLATHPVAAQMDYQPAPDLETLYIPLDQLLDSYVRDGIVYYHALETDRARLDRYVASLASRAVAADLPKWDRPGQIAFWINAYNALVLQAALNHYPASIHQVPGTFDQVRHTVAGRSVTLDQIENTILGAYNDPRIYLVLGRGAIDSGRLRSEAFCGPRLESQLAQSAEQFATAPKYVRIDKLAGTLSVSPILSWREKAFVGAYAARSMDLPGRTPLERAIVGFIEPYLLPSEREYLKQNTFKLAYLDFDWHLNDRTGVRH